MNVVVTGVGHNLASMRFALSRLGVEAVFTDDPTMIQRAERVILPGVGTARNAMVSLERAGLVEVIKTLTVPVLGVCVSMQILMISSAEDEVQTLGIIPGKIERLTPTENCPVPHMGWNTLRNIDPTSKLFRGINDGGYVYFVHSYALGKSHYAIAECVHGTQFTAAVRKDNFYGVQFHPELSGEIGARVLKNFFEVNDENNPSN